MRSTPEQLLKQHRELTHTENAKVTSHVQRESGDWILNTIMIDGYYVPFKFKRKKRYQNIRGQRVNLTYYPDTEIIAGIEFEFMKVVRIKVS